MRQWHEDLTNLADSLRLVFRARSPNQSTVKIAQSHFHEGEKYIGRNGQIKTEKDIDIQQ